MWYDKATINQSSKKERGGKHEIADPDFEGFCHCMLYYKSLQD